eukprot:3934540-Rhodomonas_salina.1
MIPNSQNNSCTVGTRRDPGTRVPGRKGLPTASESQVGIPRNSESYRKKAAPPRARRSAGRNACQLVPRNSSYPGTTTTSTSCMHIPTGQVGTLCIPGYAGTVTRRVPRYARTRVPGYHLHDDRDCWYHRLTSRVIPETPSLSALLLLVLVVDGRHTPRRQAPTRQYGL